jgi:hypothetical protein
MRAGEHLTASSTPARVTWRITAVALRGKSGDAARMLDKQPSLRVIAEPLPAARMVEEPSAEDRRSSQDDPVHDRPAAPPPEVVRSA